MPFLRIQKSCVSALYDEGSLVIHHIDHIYALDSPLKLDAANTYELLNDDGLLRITLADQAVLTLNPKSPEETKSYHMDHKIKLRAVRHKHAKKGLVLAKKIQKAMKELVGIEKQMHTECRTIAGEWFENYHTVSFEEHGSNDSQIDCDGFITTPDFASVLKMATELVGSLEPIASAESPPALPCEH